MHLVHTLNCCDKCLRFDLILACEFVFQGARHTFSEAVGKNVANPTAMLLCAAKMLRHVNLPTYSDMIRNAVNSVLQNGKVKTKDIGGQATTNEFITAVIQSLH